LFDFMPSNVDVLPFDKERYEGMGGLERFCKLLKRRKFDAVADMHDVLRSKYIRTRLRMGGARVSVIQKERKLKRRMVGHGADTSPLLNGVERYCHVLTDLGVGVQVDFQRAFNPAFENFSIVEQRVGHKSAGERWVGIAPFAAHSTKIYPLERMQSVARMLRDRGCKIWLFGGGRNEGAVLKTWEETGIKSVCGRLDSLHNEMLLMSQLDCMIAMDSANMHIASLTGIPVVSVWGATHPIMGFSPYGQPEDCMVQVKELSCRPCSVYGNLPCRYGDLHCMTAIQPETIVERCISLLPKD